MLRRFKHDLLGIAVEYVTANGKKGTNIIKEEDFNKIFNDLITKKEVERKNKE